jgi:hypothetical protein
MGLLEEAAMRSFLHGAHNHFCHLKPLPDAGIFAVFQKSPETDFMEVAGFVAVNGHRNEGAVYDADSINTISVCCRCPSKLYKASWWLKAVLRLDDRTTFSSGCRRASRSARSFRSRRPTPLLLHWARMWTR